MVFFGRRAVERVAPSGTAAENFRGLRNVARHGATDVNHATLRRLHHWIVASIAERQGVFGPAMSGSCGHPNIVAA
jgi:hypothetical protein